MPPRDIRVVAVGRLKGAFSYIEAGVDDYIRRLRPYARVSIEEVPDEAITPSRTAEQVMAREADRLRSFMAKSRCVVALSEHGQSLDSEGFARALGRRFDETNPPNGGIGDRGSGPMIVLVGGPLGLSPALLKEADWVLSLSPMTFPHPLVRLILLEQLYRAFKILNHEPYHK